MPGNQYRYIAFNNFSCRISNKTTNELTISAVLCQNVTLFYRQGRSFFISSVEKIERVQKLNFSSSFFTSDCCHLKIVWLHVLAFTEHDVLHFWENVHLLKYYLVKEPQNCFNYFNCSNHTSMKISELLFPVDIMI